MWIQLRTQRGALLGLPVFLWASKQRSCIAAPAASSRDTASWSRQQLAGFLPRAARITLGWFQRAGLKRLGVLPVTYSKNGNLYDFTGMLGHIKKK